MSNGQYAEVPAIDFEPKGILGKKAALEIDKIKMSKQQKEDAEFLEKIAREAKLERQKKKAKKDFEK